MVPLSTLTIVFKYLPYEADTVFPSSGFVFAIALTSVTSVTGYGVVPLITKVVEPQIRNL